jgi:2-phosphoglycerate kinase
VHRAEALRGWTVLLLGGASGSGKTTAACALARRLRVSVTEVDDLHTALEAVTTPEQLPAIHFWPTHADPGSLSAEAIQRQGLDVLALMRRALERVIENHLEGGTPVILEGDFVDPSLVAQERFGEEANGGRVQGVFLLEHDVDRLAAGFQAREPQLGPQRTRAEVSVLWSRWLAERCAALGVPAIEARPWANVVERLLAETGRPAER